LLELLFLHSNYKSAMFRVFLIGYMGAGKTTLGKAFARKMNVQFVDLDWYVEERFHKTIKELFEEQGEDKFRLIEQKMLHEVGEFEDIVISTGGGTPCFFDNMDYMNKMGDTVFLDVNQDVLFIRLKIAMQNRPVLQGKDDEQLRNFIRESLEQRNPFYRRAKYVFDGSKLETRAQINMSVEQLQQLLNVTHA
jgi:shikimate kinase